MGNKSLKKKIKKYTVYLLQGRDESYYAGYTVDLPRRIRLHNAGKGSKYLRARLPARLVYSKEYQKLTNALRAEYQLKQLTHIEKEILVKQSIEMSAK